MPDDITVTGAPAAEVTATPMPAGGVMVTGIPTNGKSRTYLAAMMACILAVCVLTSGGIGYVALTTHETIQNWGIVETIVKSVDTLSVLIAGGLLGMARGAGGH